LRGNGIGRGVSVGCRVGVNILYDATERVEDREAGLGGCITWSNFRVVHKVNFWSLDDETIDL
jgi:hypothetical protein